MTETTFYWLYLIGVVIASVTRVIYTRHHRSTKIEEHRKSDTDAWLMSLPALGMFVLPVVHVSSSWLDFADYRISLWTGWLGVVIFAAALWLLWRTHIELGLNWTPSLQLRQGHTLITSGVYARMRHPMYTAHGLWALALPFFFHNWISGWGMLATIIPPLVWRIPREESQLLDRYGDQYRRYMAHTGRLLPRLKSEHRTSNVEHRTVNNEHPTSNNERRTPNDR
jgi:protein-S-isoprenylcysteine O-methyltransferase Ste14